MSELCKLLWRSRTNVKTTVKEFLINFLSDISKFSTVPIYSRHLAGLCDYLIKLGFFQKLMLSLYFSLKLLYKLERQLWKNKRRNCCVFLDSKGGRNLIFSCLFADCPPLFHFSHLSLRFLCKFEEILYKNKAIAMMRRKSPRSEKIYLI